MLTEHRNEKSMKFANLAIRWRHCCIMPLSKKNLLLSGASVQSEYDGWPQVFTAVSVFLPLVEIPSVVKMMRLLREGPSRKLQ